MLTGHFSILFGEMSIQTLCLFLIGLFVFLLLSYKISLYIWGTIPLSDIWFANILSFSMSCLFTFFFFLSLYQICYNMSSFFLNKFIYLCLRWVFVAARGLSLFAVCGGYSSLRCTEFSLLWLLLLQSMGSRCADFSSCGSWALERRLSSCGARA